MTEKSQAPEGGLVDSLAERRAAYQALMDDYVAVVAERDQFRAALAAQPQRAPDLCPASGLWCAGACQPSPAEGARLSADDVQWIVNDIAELGVMIHGQAFFLYKGHSLVYEEATHDDGRGPMHYRPVFKREFGECAHPINYADLTRIGTVSLDDSDDWRVLPAAGSTPQPKGMSNAAALYDALTGSPLGSEDATLKAHSDAWFAVCAVLSELDPDWTSFGRTGTDAAGKFIKHIATFPGNPSPAPAPVAPMTWYGGPPPFPQDQEWFIAETIYGDRVALIALEEGRRKSMDWEFKTADGTFLKRASVKSWMQFPDCTYLPPAVVEAPAVGPTGWVAIWTGALGGPNPSYSHGPDRPSYGPEVDRLFEVFPVFAQPPVQGSQP